MGPLSALAAADTLPALMPITPAPSPRRHVWISIALLLCGAVALCAPFLWHGPLPAGSDVVATTHFLQGFMKAWGEGDLYPRWTDRTNKDLGAPSFVLLVPLTYYGASLAVWAAGSLIGGLKLYLLAIAALSGLSFYLLASEWIGSSLPAAFGALLYMLLPYHVLDVYQRFALSESTAFIYVPLILLFGRRALRGSGGPAAAGLTLSYAALVMTHLVSGYLVSLFAGVWLLAEARGRWRALGRPLMAMSCGLLLAAPALLPALLDKGGANLAWLTQMPNGDVRTNFLFTDEVIAGFGARDPVKRPVTLSAHSQLALSGIALALVLAAPALRRDPGRRDAITMALVSAAAYLMQTPISTPLWLAVPELATVQFPWRLQTLMVLAAALLCGMAARAWKAGGLSDGWRRWGGSALVVLVCVNLALSFWTAHLQPFIWEESVTSHPAVTTWVEPAFTPVGFTGYPHLRDLTIDHPRAAVTSGQARILDIDWRSSSRRLEIDVQVPATIRLGSFWFPGWEASLDGRPHPIGPVDALSLIGFEVPAGRHVVELRFVPSRARRWAVMLVPVGLAGMALGWVRPRQAGRARGGATA